MTNKERISKISDDEAAGLIADNCYTHISNGLCCQNCSVCLSKWLSKEVEENEIE